MTGICSMCGRRAEAVHHLIFGRQNRALCEADNICIKLCNKCHNLAIKPEDRVHGNPKAEALSKMLGQALWEADYLAESEQKKEEARIKFRERYGKSWL